MALSSMTGFARAQGVSGPYAWAWELKSVNAKGFDLRLRMPAGWDAVDAPVRAKAAEMLSRGTVYGNLSVERQGVQPTVTINEGVLGAVLDAVEKLKGRIGGAPPSVEGILGLKGVIEVSEQEESADQRAAAGAAVTAGFASALADLVKARRDEGAALARLLTARLDEIAALTDRAEKAPGRQPDAIKARLAEQVATLLDANSHFDPERLHQEAVLLASKADIREELDRLGAHVAQAKKLIDGGGPVGRRLDFLSQELNRESNTLCAKSNDVELTNIGLELKSVVEQFREQVQNLE
jgi:uncharacterized protein (TIGR00255 family)